MLSNCSEAVWDSDLQMARVTVARGKQIHNTFGLFGKNETKGIKFLRPLEMLYLIDCGQLLMWNQLDLVTLD